MSLNYLPEHAENARLALELALKERGHLAYTRRTLFAQNIDLQWVKSLEQREDLSEKIDAFVGRFSRLQDHIGEKLIPRFAALLAEQPKSLLDVLAYAEKIGGSLMPKHLSAQENSETYWYMNTWRMPNCFWKRLRQLMRQPKC